MKENIQITASHFVPNMSVQDFSDALSPIISVSCERIAIDRQRTIEHFDFQPNRDLIFLFAGQILNFAVSALRELPKELLKDQLKELIYSVIKNKGEKAASVQIKLSYRDIKAEINGQITTEHVLPFIEGFTTMIATDKLNMDSQNPRYHKDPVEWRGVKYNYDTNKKLLLPHDFEQDRQELYKRMRELGH